MSEGFLSDHPTLAHCPACGHKNPPSHKFCGACGATLEENAPRSEISEREPADRYSAEADSHELETETTRESSSKTYSSGQVFEDSITNPRELSLFRSFRPADSSDDADYEDESGFRRYRVYIGAILAVILTVLGYMAWRSSQAASQRSHEAPPPPVAAKETPAPAPATAATNTPRTTSTERKAMSKNAESAPKAAKTESTDSASERASAPAASTAASGQQSAPDNGVEELAMAQRYLNGFNGQGRDSAEAAKWLWKSIAKHNSAATVLLADLYLKGEGVSKNCDQARVLLDSAARKGYSPAGERLRNLQAFGCQ